MLFDKSDVMNLAAGEVYFGTEVKKIKTLLGSCVALSVWHSKYQIAGMCHYLIAQEKISSKEQVVSNRATSTSYRYGNNALHYLLQEMSCYSPINEFEIRLFGGSNMYEYSTSPTIGESNVNFAMQWLEANQLKITQQDTLGDICRTLIFDTSNGSIQLRRYQQEIRGENNDN